MRSRAASERRSEAAGRARPGARRRLLPPACLAAGALLLTGCENQPKLEVTLDSLTKKIFEPKRSPQQYMLVAVSDPDADLRRDAVARIARSDVYDRDWAVQGLIAIALLESDPQARCVAVRALARGGDPRATEALLKLLNHLDQPQHEVRPPDDVCRWDAAGGLAALSSRGQVPEEAREAVAATLLKVLHDPDRHVRISAARGLGYYNTAEVLRGLIAGLRDRDFAVARECEMSLVRLTGVTHDCDGYAWTAWLEQNSERAFAHAGDVPASRRPKYTNFMEETAYGLWEWGRFLMPGKKER
jgi:hypothetical protein